MTKRTVTTRRLTDGTHVITGCFEPNHIVSRIEDFETLPPWYDPDGEVHSQFNAYLLSDDRTLLFDTLPPNMRSEIVEEVEGLLDGETLDYVVVSHPEAPHGGNASALLDAHPEATLLVPEADALHEAALGTTAGDRHEISVGDHIDLGSRTVEFVEPVLFDLAATAWMVDHGTGTLFTADAYGNPHTDAECGAFVDELTDDPETFTTLRWIGFHSHTFPWLAYADPERIDAAIEDRIEQVDPALVAPAHGAPIRTDATDYLRRLTPVVENISQLGLGQDTRMEELLG